MIGFNNLGRMGRLANQMFQYASLKGIAKNRGYEYMISYHADAVNDGIGNMLRTELFDLFDLDVRTGIFNAPVVGERQHNFDQELFDNCPDNVVLQGYFQTEKYFKHIEDEIRKDFTFKNVILEPCKEMMDSIESDRKIFLHIRRGDPKLPWAYVNLEARHPVCTFDYYEKALAEFPDDIPVIVFSDHIEWCQEQDFFKPDRFILSESTDELDDGQRVPWTDLCLMSLCTDAIIANSSFSWWGAWLIDNPDKTVIAPKKWFGPSYDHYHMDDLIPKGWKVL